MQDFFELILAENHKSEIARVLDVNAKTEQFGLVLSQEDAAELMIAPLYRVAHCGGKE